MTGIARVVRVRLELARRFPAVDAGQAHVHQDQRRRLRPGHGHALLAVDGDDHLVAPPRQAARQHVAVHLVVLDEQDLGHQAPRPRGARDAGRHQLAHLGQQLLAAVRALLENLLHVPVEPLAVLGGQVLGGDHHDRDGPPGLVAAELGDELEAVHLRHHQVEQDQLGRRRRAGAPAPPGRSPPRPPRSPPRSSMRRSSCADVGVVLHDQHRRGRAGAVLAARRPGARGRSAWSGSRRRPSA